MFGVAQTFVQNLKDKMAARILPCNYLRKDKELCIFQEQAGVQDQRIHHHYQYLGSFHQELQERDVSYQFQTLGCWTTC